MQEIDFQDLLIDAWNKFKERWKPLCLASTVGYFLPLVIMMTVFAMFFFRVMDAARYGNANDVSAPVFLFVTIFVFAVVILLFSVGTENYCMKICRGGNPTYKDFLLPFNVYLRLFGASFIAALLINLGVIVCVIPGLVLAFFFSFVTYAVIDHPELGVISCIKHSCLLVRRYWKPILILLLIDYAIQSVIGGTIIGLIPCIPFRILLTSLLYTKFNDESATTIAGKLS